MKYPKIGYGRGLVVLANGNSAQHQADVTAYYKGNVPWLKTGDLNDGIIRYIPETISELALADTSVKMNAIGSILIAIYGAAISKIGILAIEATTNQVCCRLLGFLRCYQHLFFFLLSQRNAFISKGVGGAQPNISKEIIVNRSYHYRRNRYRRG